MSKKKTIIKLLFVVGVIIFTGISFILISYLMRPVTNSRKNICGFYAEEKESLDVIYIGGSAAYLYWEPLSAWKEYGFTSYNFGLDSIQPQIIPFILEETEKTQSPSLYIIDVRPFQYGDLYSEEENSLNMEKVAPFRNFSDNIKYSRNRYKLIEKHAPKKEEVWTYHFDLAKYHSNLFSFINPESWRYIFNKKKLYTKGFSFYDEVYPIVHTDTTEIEAELPLEEEIDELFCNLLKYCKEKELQVLFIVHAYANSETDQMKYNYIERRVREEGFDFINMNDYFYEIGLNPEEDFRDVDHVNLIGADKYTSFLAKYLDENYEFQDKRGLEVFSDWDKDFERWTLEVEEAREKLNE